MRTTCSTKREVTKQSSLAPSPLNKAGNHKQPSDRRRRHGSRRHKPVNTTSLIDPLQKPITHLFAGQSIKAPTSIQKQSSLSTQLCESVGQHSILLKHGCEQGILSEASIIHALATGDDGSAEQHKALQKLTAKVSENAATTLSEFVKKLPQKFRRRHRRNSFFRSWEFCFSLDSWLYSDGDIYSSSFRDIPELPEYVFSDCGLTVLNFDLFLGGTTPDMDLLQLIYFASELSLHGTTLQIFEDSPHAFPLLGDCMELDSSEQQAIADQYLSGDDVANIPYFKNNEEFYDDHQILMCCKALHAVVLSRNLLKQILPLSKDNVQSYLDRLCRSSGEKTLLIELAAMILQHTDWQAAENHTALFFGDISGDFTRPISLGLPAEYDLLDCMHDMIMQTGETGSISIPCNEYLHGTLANIHVGESVLFELNKTL